MANAYNAQQANLATSERSYGVPGPDPSLVPQVVSSTSRGFDWRDAGIGASSAFGIALLTGLNQYYLGQPFGSLKDYVGLFLWAARKDGEYDPETQRRLGIRRRTRL